MFSFTTLFSTVLEVLVNAIRQEKEINDILFKKEGLKLSLFTHGMTVNVESLKESIKPFLELINDYSKVTGYKVNIAKAIISYIPAKNK